MCLGSLLSYLGPGEALGVENIMSTPDHTPYTPPFTTHAFTLLLDYPYHFYTSPLNTHQLQSRVVVVVATAVA